MKPEGSAEQDKQLSGVLRQWQVAATLPPRFQEQVWRRIARADAGRRPAFWTSLSVWLESVFQRPALAVSYVAVLLMLGVMTGFWQVKDKAAASETQWRVRYVQSVDPYRMPH